MQNRRSVIHGDTSPYTNEQVQRFGLYQKMSRAYGSSAVVLNENVDSLAYMEIARNLQGQKWNYVCPSPLAHIETVDSLTTFRLSAQGF